MYACGWHKTHTQAQWQCPHSPCKCSACNRNTCSKERIAQRTHWKWHWKILYCSLCGGTSNINTIKRITWRCSESWLRGKLWSSFNSWKEVRRAGEARNILLAFFEEKKNLSFLLWGNRSFLFSYEFRNRQFWNWSSAIIPLFLACRQNRTEKSFYFSLHFVAAESKLLSSFTLWGVSTPLPKLMLASKRWRCLSSDWKMSHSYFYYFYI